MNLEVHGTSDYQIDKFNLGHRSGLIASRLWRGEKIPENEIEGICHSVLPKTARNSDVSTDSIDGIPKNPEAITDEENIVKSDALSSEITTLINDFLEVTEEIAEDRSKRKKQDPMILKSSLQLFTEQMRKTQHDPHILKIILDSVADEYC